MIDFNKNWNKFLLKEQREIEDSLGLLEESVLSLINEFPEITEEERFIRTFSNLSENIDKLDFCFEYAKDSYFLDKVKVPSSLENKLKFYGLFKKAPKKLLFELAEHVYQELQKTVKLDEGISPSIAKKLIRRYNQALEKYQNVKFKHDHFKETGNTSKAKEYREKLQTIKAGLDRIRLYLIELGYIDD